MPTNSRRNNDDHDLLIRIDTKLDSLAYEFKSFQSTTEQQLALKADQTEVLRLEAVIKDQEQRMKGTEHVIWGALGIIGFIEVLAAVATAIHFYVR